MTATTEPTGDCFKAAVTTAQTIEHSPIVAPTLARTVTVCHGLPLYQGEGDAPEPGGRYWHAWVEVTSAIDLGPIGMDGQTTTVTVYIDYSNGKEIDMPVVLAYKIGGLDTPDAPPIRRYTVAHAVTAAAISGQWGPWDDTGEEPR